MMISTKEIQLSMKKFVILFLFPIQVVFGQETLSLEKCYTLARENYPVLKDQEIYQQITSLKKKNIQAQRLPRVALNGQATYQSDVPGIALAAPNLSIPTVPKDQYKAYAEINQTLWDGGISDARRKLEDALLKSSLSELEVEIYQLKEQVAQAFFTVQAANKQKRVIEAQKKALQAQLDNVQSGIRSGVIEKSAALSLKSGIFLTDQKANQLESAQSAALKILSILTGRPLSPDIKLSVKEKQFPSGQKQLRPEILLFSDRQAQLKTRMNLLEKERNPRIFGFGQAGLGKPGLNMLNDDFDTYYLAGVGLKWNAFDWKQTHREKQILELQQQAIQHQKEKFNQHIGMLLAQQEEKITEAEKQLETDRKIIDLKTAITEMAASKLQNGVLTSSEYVRELQAETIAKLNHELHKIQLTQAREKLQFLQGEMTGPANTNNERKK